MTDWGSLSDAYGPAGEVGQLLRRANAEGNESDAWDDLWGRLCHQGTVSHASYAALPELLPIAEHHAGAPCIQAAVLAGAILASTDGPRHSADVRSEHATTIEGLRAVAAQSLAAASSDADFVYSLEALLAFEDRGPWQRHLNHLADEEVPLECPHCHEHLLLDLTDDEFLLSTFSDATCRPTAVPAASPPAGSHEHRVLELAEEHGRERVAEQVRHVVGDVVCPRCGQAFWVPGALD